MSFKLASDRPLPAAIRQLANDRLDMALALLEPVAFAADTDTAVHDTRKRIKELRAVLRLARGALGKQYRSENRLLRDIARQLSTTRDARAVLETFDKLTSAADGNRSALTPQALQAIRSRLEARQEQAVAAPGLQSALPELRTELIALRGRVPNWRFREDDFDTICPGLEASYRAGRRQLRQLYNRAGDVRGEPEDFHEWRKRVKDQWYQTKLLHDFWPQGLKGRAKALKQLADVLGDEHDLQVLRTAITDEPKLFGTAATAAALEQLAATRQQQLRDEALPLGSLLYAEKTPAYLARMAAYWAVQQQFQIP